MASSFTSDVISLIEASGLGWAYGTNLFKGPKAVIPDGSGPYASLIRTGGFGVDGTHNSPDLPAYEQPSGQIIVRATSYDVAEAAAQALYEYLPRRNQFINSTWWVKLRVRGEIYDLPIDEKLRPRLAFNFGCEKRTSPSTS